MKNAALITTAAACLLTVAVVSVTWANQGSQSDPPLPLNQLYPGPLGMANFGKIISGDFTGDLKRDAIVMDGTQPKLLVSPDTFDTAISMGGAANDIAVLSGIVAGKDLVLAVGGTGIQRYERDSTNATWINSTIPGTASTWTAARLLCVGEVNGAGAADLVGIAANGRDVLIRHGYPSGAFMPGPTFQAQGQTVYGLLLLNWREVGDTPGTLEIALLTNLGVELHEANGANLESISWAPSILATVIRDAAQGVQRLAMVSKVSGVDQYFVYGDNASEGPYALGAAGVVSMASGDTDADGDTEVFLGVSSENKFWMLENLAPALPGFDVGAVQKFAYGPPGRDPSINHAGLVAADFDNDDALDALCPAQGDLTGAITVFGSVPLVRVGNPNAAAYRVGVTEVEYVPATHELEFHFTAPATVLAAPAGAETQLSVKIWNTPDFGVSTIPTPVHVSFQPLPAPETVFHFPLPPTYSVETSTGLYSFVVRQAVVASGGSVLDISPAMTGIFAPEPRWPIVRDAPDTTLSVPTSREDSSTPTPSGGFGGGPTVPGEDEEEEPRNP